MVWHKYILCRYDQSQITISMDSSSTSLIDKRILTLIGQYLPPISPIHDAGPALISTGSFAGSYAMIDAVSKRERVKLFQAYRLGSYTMNNITSVICCFITRFGKT